VFGNRSEISDQFHHSKHRTQGFLLNENASESGVGNGSVYLSDEH
jgi:hypothetical protein